MKNKIIFGTWCKFWNSDTSGIAIERFETELTGYYMSTLGNSWDFCEPLSDEAQRILKKEAEPKPDPNEPPF